MSKKILIAEDSVTLAAAYKHALAALGYEVLVAHDGEEAERQILAECPDLVILDVIMPKVDGFQLCRRIRAHPELQDIPIIVFTVLDRDSDRYWGLKQGATEYLIKQADPRILIEKVRSYLQ
jgi:twitching motility two-component system response regulator PilH